jgi:hypothetical protein
VEEVTDMAANLHTENVATGAAQPAGLTGTAQPSLAELVNGIVNDAQRLIRQETLLARQEVQQSINNAKAVAISAGIAAGIGVLGAVMFLLMVVHLFHLIPGLPLWGCYAIVFGGCAMAAAAAVGIARTRAGEIVPQQTVESVKENVQWLKNQT